MTESELRQISLNNQKLQQMKNKYEDERFRSLVKGQNITGMPHAPGVKDNIGNYVTDLVMLQETIETLQRINNLLIIDARKFIDSIPDGMIRIILELKYINNIPDYSIPSMVGNNIKERDVKKIIRTFFLDCLLYM
nr:hypothetical protein [uncultured Anaerocolumna sp.]